MLFFPIRRCLVGRFADDAARQRCQSERRQRDVGQRWPAPRHVTELPVPTRRNRSAGKALLDMFVVKRIASKREVGADDEMKSLKSSI